MISGYINSVIHDNYNYRKVPENICEKRKYKISELIQLEVNKYIIGGGAFSDINFIGLGCFDWFDFWREEFFDKDPTLQTFIIWNNSKLCLNQGPERNISIVSSIEFITGVYFPSTSITSCP